MYIVLIPIVLIVVMSVFSLMSYKKNKEYYLNNDNENEAETIEYKNRVLDIIKAESDNGEACILVNAHNITQVSVVVKVTSFYSYALLFNTQTKYIQVISYNPSNNNAENLGKFPLSRVKAIDLNDGFQTNYSFLDNEEKELFAVSTLGHEVPGIDEYQIKYFQETNYNILRNAFNLANYSYQNKLKGDQ